MSWASWPLLSNPGWQFLGDDLFRKRAYQDAREMIRRDRQLARPVVLWEAGAERIQITVPWRPVYIHRLCMKNFLGRASIQPETRSAGLCRASMWWDVGYVPYQHLNPDKPVLDSGSGATR